MNPNDIISYKHSIKIKIEEKKGIIKRCERTINLLLDKKMLSDGDRLLLTRTEDKSIEAEERIDELESKLDNIRNGDLSEVRDMVNNSICTARDLEKHEAAVASSRGRAIIKKKAKKERTYQKLKKEKNRLHSFIQVDLEEYKIENQLWKL